VGGPTDPFIMTDDAMRNGHRALKTNGDV